MVRQWTAVIAALLLGVFLGASVRVTKARAASSQTDSSSSGNPTVWYFYRVQWGHQDEFLELYRKNHYPVLKAQLGNRITGFKAYVPMYHGDGRADWTFVTELTFRDAAALSGPSGEEEIARRLFPDFEIFRNEESRRFEVLDAHWDVPLTEVKME